MQNWDELLDRWGVGFGTESAKDVSSFLENYFSVSLDFLYSRVYKLADEIMREHTVIYCVMDNELPGVLHYLVSIPNNCLSHKIQTRVVPPIFVLFVCESTS